MSDKPASSLSTQARRRALYGSNVLVASLVVVLLVIVVNVLVVWAVNRPQAMGILEWDVTATRQYSLSAQTRNVVAALKDDYKICTVFGNPGAQSLDQVYVEQAQMLVDQYGRAGPRISAEHIRPAMDLGRMPAFLESIVSRYEDQLQPLDQAIKDARTVLAGLRESAPGHLARLRAAATDPGLADEEPRRFLGSAVQAFARFDADLAAIDQQLDQALSGPLPNYSQARALIVTLLQQLDERFLGLAIQQFDRFGKQPGVPGALKEKLLELADAFRRQQEPLKRAAAALDAAKGTPEYDAVRDRIEAFDSIVILGPRQVRVLAVHELFRRPDPRQVQPGQRPELRFQGEEKITGELISMSLEHQPLVVFVSPGRRPPLGPNGGYEQAAQRLRHLNFDVQQWNPLGQTGPMGAAASPGPAPEPKPGQRAVWVLLPSEPMDPQMMMLSAGGDQKAAQHVQERLARGDAALVMLAANPSMGFTGANPIAQVLETWGIRPQLDRVVLKQIALPNGKAQPTNRLDITQWPSDPRKDLPITVAIAGTAGVFLQASPLDIAGEPPKDATIWPLVTVAGPDVWAETNLNDADVKRPDGLPAQRFVIAAAVQRGDQRLIVVADPAWASDDVTTYAEVQGQRVTPEVASMFGVGVRFPANSELLVNSVTWLAGLDQLIAASARSQDIRRIRMEMTLFHRVILAASMLGGIVILTTGAGVAVWMVRRRS